MLKKNTALLTEKGREASKGTAFLKYPKLQGSNWNMEVCFF